MPDSGYWILDNFLKGNLRSAGGLTEFVLPSMLGSWPGGKGVARRKHRPGEPFSQGLRSISAERGEPVGDPPDRPYADSTRRLSLALCSPVPWNRRCLMISAGNALGPGPGSA